MIGDEILSFAKQLWPIPRSLTGPGVRKTLALIKQHLPDLQIQSVKSGTQCFDWVVPHEWQIKDAYILDPNGNKIIDIKNNNLHVVGYSTPINVKMSLSDLNKNLHSLPDQPTAIPYITSYYSERWGFCVSTRCVSH